MGAVTLGVADLDRMIGFYRDSLGLSVLAKSDQSATLGVSNGKELVRLCKIENPLNPGRRAPGLFHLAILYPSRASLGKALIQLAQSGWRLSGAGDHLVSEALYLDDPEGNGIEMYCDRPRDTWKFDNGKVQMDTLAVDIDSIVAEAQADPTAWDGIPEGTTMGHVHLKVSNLVATEKFYGEVLGFDLMANMPQALFMAVGGYHHHLGLNTWMSGGSPAPAKNAIGLKEVVIEVSTQDSLDQLIGHLSEVGLAHDSSADGVRLVDPSGNHLKFVVR